MRIRSTVILLATASAASAQSSGSAFTQTGHAASITFVTDYQSIGVNPANLGWRRTFPEKKVTFGLAEIGDIVSTTAFDRAGLKEDLIGSLLNDPEDFTYSEKEDAAKRFTDANLIANLDAMLGGASYQYDSMGGFAFSYNVRSTWYTQFNQDVAEIMFLGYNASYFEYLALDVNGDGLPDDTIANDANVTDEQRAQAISGGTYNGKKVSKILGDDSEYDFLLYRSFNLAWGSRVVDGAKADWFVGLGVKYVQGLGMIDINTDGGFTGINSLSPGFKVDYGDDASKNPSYVSGDDLVPVGNGFGVDVGISVIVDDKWKVGLAYNDIGSITWDGNVWEAADSTLSQLDEDGFDNYNFFDQADNFASDRGVFEWNGTDELKTKLPGTIRTGVGMVASEKLEVGLETVIPMTDDPGAMKKALFNIGGAYRPAPWISLNTGVCSGGNYPTRVPFGATVTTATGTWEVGFSMQDMISLFGSGDPTIGMCFGVLRFRV